MRRLREELRERGIDVHYTELPRRRSRDRGADFASVLAKDVQDLRPEKLVLTRPGDFRILASLEEAARKLDVELEVRDDRHFHSTPAGFQAWAEGRKQLVHENFYRTLRRIPVNITHLSATTWARRPRVRRGHRVRLDWNIGDRAFSAYADRSATRSR